jgi:hypothetical protein
MSWYRRSPYVRFALRTLAVAAISYVIAAFAQGAETGDFLDWSSFGWGLVGAVCKAALGLLTIEEPFVGIKPHSVEVPSPPAIEDASS